MFLRRLTWPIASALGPRVLAGLKFLVIARVLGPKEFGEFGVALIWLGVVDTLSDFGFRQALVQHRDLSGPSVISQMQALLFIRGLALIPVVLLAAQLSQSLLPAVSWTSLVAVAVVPLFRGPTSLVTALELRALNYRGLSLYEGAWRTGDLVLTASAALLRPQGNTVVVTTVIGEVAACLVAHLCFRRAFSPKRPTQQLVPFRSYGRWVWLSAVLTVVLQQFDKAFVAVRFGLAAAGSYQGASRLVQLLLVDPVNMTTGVLFPRVAQAAHANRQNALTLIGSLLRIYSAGLMMTANALSLMRESIITAALGLRWQGEGGLFSLFVATMVVGSLITLMVLWHTSVGVPRAVALATATQAVGYIGFATVLGPKYGAMGVAVAVWCAALTALFALGLQVSPTERRQLLVNRCVFGALTSSSVLVLAGFFGNNRAFLLVEGLLSAAGAFFLVAEVRQSPVIARLRSANSDAS